MRAQGGRIAYLDGWRVLAITLVFLDHLGMNKAIGAFYAHSPFGFVSEYGEVGVFIFFFISGHVVAGGCLNEIERTGDFSARAFYVRRFFRIVPPLMVYLAVCRWLGSETIIDFSFANFFSSAACLCNTTAPFVSCNWYVGHTWSLAFEEQFYILFPIVLSYVELGRRPTFPVAVSAALVVSLPFVFTIWWIGKTGFLIAYALFFAGYAAAKFGDRFIACFGRFTGAALLASALVAFLPRSVVAAFGDSESARAELIAYYRLLHIAAIPTMVLLSGIAKTISHDVLSNRIVAYLGRASYSIYLWQQLANGPVFNDLDVYAQLGLLSCVVLFCIALFEIVEVRLTAMGRALSGRMKRSRHAVREESRAELPAIATASGNSR